MDVYLENFEKVYTKEVFLHKEINDEDIRLIYYNCKSLVIVDRNDIGDRIPSIYNNLHKVPKTFFVIDNHVKLHYYAIGNNIYHYLNYVSQEDMINQPTQYIEHNKFATNDYKKSRIILKLEKQNNSYFICYYINKSIIKKCLSSTFSINNSKESSYGNLLFSLLLQQKKQDIIQQCVDKLKNTKFYTSDTFNNDKLNDYNDFQLKSNVELFDYQKRDIIWMNYIQKQVDTNNSIIKYPFNLYTTLLNDKFTFLYDGTVVPSDRLKNSLLDTDIERYVKNKHICYYGGNIISEVGLGKTLICLCQIFINGKRLRDRFNHFVEFDKKCNYVYKRGINSGKVCEKECEKDSLYCKKHRNTLFLDKRIIKYNNLQEFCLSDFVSKDIQKYVTNSTLIIAPNQLCDQWVREYYDKFINDKRIVLMITKDQYNNITFGDILFADIVVVSYQFLTKLIEYNNIGHNLDTNSLESEDDKLELLNSKRVDLTNFMWNSVFLDEAHEIDNMIKKNIVKHTISELKSTYKWNITGTPFANGITGFLSLLSYNTDVGEMSIDNNITLFSMIQNGINEKIIDETKHLFRCNTKVSVQNEISENIITEHTKLLTFTQQERNIYDSYIEGGYSKYDSFLIKLCCHPDLYNETKNLIKNCKTLDEIQNAILNLNKNELDFLKNQIQNLQCQIFDKKKYLDTILDQNCAEYDQERNELSVLRTKLTKSVSNHENIKRRFEYLKNAIESLRTEQETCPICLDTINKDDSAITSCGHKFCWSCINELNDIIGKNTSEIKCPTCNTFISKNDIYKVIENSEYTHISDLDSIIHEIRSTKIGNIIYFIQTMTQHNDKIIIFSQWDEMLHKVGDILKKCNIKILYCNGSVYNRNKSINQFRNDNTSNIIMLSSKNSASGINLTAANKIILLEPIYGNAEFRKSIESQAVGRADRIGQNKPIDVIRFIVRDTIEEDILNDKIDDSRLKQIN